MVLLETFEVLYEDRNVLGLCFRAQIRRFNQEVIFPDHGG